MATPTNRLRNWPVGTRARRVWEYQDLEQKILNIICRIVADLKSLGGKFTHTENTQQTHKSTRVSWK